MTIIAVTRKPTTAELNLLATLWEIGPATVRQVHDAVSQKQNSGYTTVLKILQIMFNKGFVERDESMRAHVYSAKVSANQTQADLIEDLINSAFSGSSKQLVLQALNQIKSKTDVADIMQVLEQQLA
ncbi:BlaI/MecI/CopY family transcriptional regulator [Thalassotalea psychrophila]|uniref:BlaI/MecI/CopY family transcriptional regulator n=1 Tax=Thalassotalea psychrophila TaxID=3065647 RepID=A0ABY9TUT8_9GAMM|nr:BlaI/MecI/CopY family transcriptional regulator [Colwelliaceae bacterium SQ149]